MNLTENQTTEFKREYIDDIKKTVIAFANTAGGRIYIGIADNGEAVGVSDACLLYTSTETAALIILTLHGFRRHIINTESLTVTERLKER